MTVTDDERIARYNALFEGVLSFNVQYPANDGRGAQLRATLDIGDVRVSVLCHGGAYGRDGFFEVAVITEQPYGFVTRDYCPDATDDVLGWLTPVEVGAIIMAVRTGGAYADIARRLRSIRWQ